MTAVVSWARRNPARFMAIVDVIIGWLYFTPLPAEFVVGLLTIAGALQGTKAVHDVVAPLSKVAETTATAARDAAETTAKALSNETAGAVDTVTETGQTIAAIAGAGAAHAALEALGVPRKVRRKVVGR